MSSLKRMSQLENSGSMISIQNRTTVSSNGPKEHEKMREFMEHQNVLQERLDILKSREDNWDDEGSKAPTNSTVKNAEDIITTLLSSAICLDGNWFNPFITSDLDGDITAMWRKDERELHLQIGEENVEYFKVWGINIHTEMDVNFLKNEDYLTIWQWLITGE